jgi:hypothetical protein
MSPSRVDLYKQICAQRSGSGVVVSTKRPPSCICLSSQWGWRAATVSEPVMVEHSCAPSRLDEVGPVQGGDWAQTSHNWAQASDMPAEANFTFGYEWTPFRGFVV